MKNFYENILGKRNIFDAQVTAEYSVTYMGYSQGGRNDDKPSLRVRNSRQRLAVLGVHPWCVAQKFDLEQVWLIVDLPTRPGVSAFTTTLTLIFNQHPATQASRMTGLLRRSKGLIHLDMLGLLFLMLLGAQAYLET
ncbi:hypothetical protein VN97_g1935 [Penicillium thymicola]|uniref:Uncharacterized protein n=1 Tax=Penicillium thymicola TaxID=293382 RepID=A0AAI9TQ33_PENTH|nr:hypothetical protein VN97_g1935 [Penicillium thymicola]